jgi:hypothetical protein
LQFKKFLFILTSLGFAVFEGCSYKEIPQEEKQSPLILIK